jgi:hypothetical protein
MKRVWLVPALGALVVILVACDGLGTSPAPVATPSATSDPWA